MLPINECYVSFASLNLPRKRIHKTSSSVFHVINTRFHRLRYTQIVSISCYMYPLHNQSRISFVEVHRQGGGGAVLVVS